VITITSAIGCLLPFYRFNHDSSILHARPFGKLRLFILLGRLRYDVGDADLHGHQVICDDDGVPVAVSSCVLDVSDEKSIICFADFCDQKFGKIDLLFNCAGIAVCKEFGRTSSAEFTEVAAIDYTGTALMVKHSLPLIQKSGRAGKTYNIGGENEWENIKLLNKLIQIVCKNTGLNEENVRKTITHVTDRLGHDRRYAIDCTKIKNELDWKRNFDFETGLENTVDWYLNNKKWIENVRSGEYRNWIEKNYKER